MQLFKFFVVFLALIGVMCSAKMVIKMKEPDGLGALEEPAINILTNCYANRDKTILLSGSFPSSFVLKLTSRRGFSLVLLDDRKRLMENTDYSMGTHRNTQHKVHIAVILATNSMRYSNIVKSLMVSRYYNTMAFFLIIGWSSEKKYAVCAGSLKTINMLYTLYWHDEILNINLLCNHHRNGIVLYGFHPFGNQAPKPWQFLAYSTIPNKPTVHWFVRKYNENKDVCQNLDYEKTQDLGGTTIRMIHRCPKSYCSLETDKNRPRGRREMINEKKRSSYIFNFIAYVNATAVHVFKEFVPGGIPDIDGVSFVSRPWMMRATSTHTCTYPHGRECMFLLTKFRGNKSQLEKIISVIDGYSWIGMPIVYFVTLMFFKYFLRQPLMEAILNLIRLTCNMGITTVPRNIAPQIYMACLLSFVVTMQGIFVGNLAALLTQDTPVRQVDSIQDLAELGYTVYASITYFILFNDVLPEHRVVALPNDVPCDQYIKNVSIACLESSQVYRDIALKNDLHLSECVRMEYIINILPRNWSFEEILNKYLGVLISGDILMPLYYIVDEKRLLEAELEDVEPEPRIMVLNDLGFAFVIFGIGLACSLVTFVIEIMIYRYHHRVRRTRVLFLN